MDLFFHPDELAVVTDRRPHGRIHLLNLIGSLTVGLVVVMAAQPVVIYPG